MDLRELVRAWRSRWRVVVSLVVLGGALATAYSVTATPQYSASSQLFVTTTSAADSSSALYQGGQFSQQRVTSYTQLLRGDQVAQRAVDQLGLRTTAAALSSQLTVGAVPNSVILTVSATDASPTTARDITNAVATQFIDLVAQLETPPAGGAPAARVSVVQQAVTPTAPVSPSYPRNIALGLALGLVLGIMGATVRERTDTTVKTRERAAEAAGTAVVGTIPFDKDRPEHPLIDFDSRSSPSAEAFRTLRTNLQFLDVDNPPAVLTVTSAVPGEGKTTTAVNLAHVLAESDKRVVLVEADLRRPRVARYLGLVETVGLTTVLAGQAELADVVQSTANPNLVVLAAGAHPPKPSELLGSAQMRTLLAELRELADYVVFDAPPLLAVTDATVLSTITDGTLLVVRHGHTKRDQLSGAAGNLAAVEAPVLGVVVNMTPHRGGDEYAYYYYESDEDVPSGPRAVDTSGDTTTPVPEGEVAAARAQPRQAWAGPEPVAAGAHPAHSAFRNGAGLHRGGRTAPYL